MHNIKGVKFYVVFCKYSNILLPVGFRQNGKKEWGGGRWGGEEVMKFFEGAVFAKY